MAPIRKKLVIVGDQKIGKSSFLFVYVWKFFPDLFFNAPNEAYLKNIDKVQLALFDTYAHEDYDRVRPLAYPSTDVVLLAFRVDSHESLKNVQAKWLHEVKKYCRNCPILLVGLGIDLSTDLYKKDGLVTPEEGMEMAKQIGAVCYLECSSLWEVGVAEVIECAMQAALSKRKMSAKDIEALNAHTFEQRELVKKKPIGSPYNDHITKSSIQALEEVMGVAILAPLAEKYTDVIKITKMELKRYFCRALSRCTTNFDRLWVTLNWWAATGCYLLTWKTLLQILDGVNLKHISQQIHGYLSKSGYLSTYHQVLASRECVDLRFVKVIQVDAFSSGKIRACGSTMEIKDTKWPCEATRQPSREDMEVITITNGTTLATSSEWAVSKNFTDKERMLIHFFYSQAKEKQSSKPKQNLQSVSRSSHASLLTKFKEGFQRIRTTLSAKKKSAHYEDDYNIQLSQDTINLADLFPDPANLKDWNDVKPLLNDTAFLKIETTDWLEFMDVLPALTIGPSLYLLLCKLTDQLTSHYTLNLSKDSALPGDRSYTMEEILRTALASISCFNSYPSMPTMDCSEITMPVVSEAEEHLATCSSSLACNSSLACIVWTYEHVVTEAEIDVFDETLQKSIRSTNFFREGLICCHTEKRMVLPIENVKEMFLKKGLKQHFEKLSIPVSWLVLGLILCKSDRRITSTESALLLAGELGISRQEAVAALQFLHHNAGVLAYFPEHKDLKDMIICDRQVVYDSAINLIVNAHKLRQVNPAAAERFHETGLFSLEEIGKVTRNISGDYIPLKKLVKLLEHLSIIAQVQSQTLKDFSSQRSQDIYFMPCALQTAPHEELEKCLADAQSSLLPAPLFYSFKSGYAPLGIFPAMIANLVGKESLHIIFDGIKKNCVRFQRGIKSDMITLISHPKYYAVSITQTSFKRSFIYELCSEIRSKIETALKKVIMKMSYGLDAGYHLAFECPNHPGREHLCTVESDTNVLCPEDKQLQEMMSEQSVWFHKETTVQSSDQVQVPCPQPIPVARDLASYVSSLPPPARPHLELELDWGQEGGDKDLCEIADHMLGWEELATPLGLTTFDIDDIAKGIQGRDLQRREILKRWKQHQAHKATYGNLLELFVIAGHTQGAEAIIDVLHKYPD